MAKTTTFVLDPNNPPEMSPEEVARMDAMTDEEIEAAADDEPPYTPKMEESIRVIHAVRRTRKTTGLSQARFADRYGFNTRTLQEWEQGRSTPDSATQNYLRLIENDPEGVTKVIAAE
jgi:putative transcriptional regulator